jgi:hypothetical protein
MGEKGNSRDWVFFHFDPGGRNAKPVQRFLRTHDWKLYEDGRMFDMKTDNNEQNPILPEDDNDKSKKNRQSLKKIFGQMK